MYSTLQFNKSLRESGISFERIACSSDGRHIMSIDPSTRRYWGNGKHVKARHETGVFFGPDKRTILLHYLDHYQCFLSVTAHRNTKENKSVLLASWDHNMKKSKEVCLGSKKYSTACIDPDQKYIILCGENLLVVVIGKPPAIVPAKSTLNEPLSETLASTELSSEPLASSDSTTLTMSEYQQLSLDDMRGAELNKVKIIDYVTPSVVVMCSSTDCYLCVRLPPAPPAVTPASRHVRRQRRPLVITPEMRGPFPFKCIRFDNSGFVEREGAILLALKTWSTESAIYFMLGYSDGQVCVFISHSLAETATGLTNYDQTIHEESVAIIQTPQLVCSFAAYSADPKIDPVSKPLSTMGIRVSPSISQLGGMFTFELFTMDRKGTVCHWGIAALSKDVKCALLGFYSMGVDRRLEFSNADATKSLLFKTAEATSQKIIQTNDRPEILVLLSSFMNSPHRSIVCSVSGQMCFLSVVQPQVVLMKRKQLPHNPLVLIGACMGASESMPSFRSTRLLKSVGSSTEWYHGPEMLALEKEGNIVNCISVLDGAPLFDYSVQCPSDFADVTDVLQRVIPPKSSVTGKHCPIAYNSSVNLPSKVQDTEMSCATYSASLGCTIIGYQSGAICAFLAKNSVNEETNNISEHYASFRYSTKEVHGTPIRCLLTVTKNDNNAEYLISADDSGLIVVWHLALDIVKSSPTHLWTSNAHVGSVVSLQLITIPCRSEESKKFELEGQVEGPPMKFYDHKILVSACTAGIIKSWKLMDPGVLNIVGCLRTGAKPHITSALAVGFLKNPEEPTRSPVPIEPIVQPAKGKPPTHDSGKCEDDELERLIREEEDRKKPVLFEYEPDQLGRKKWVEPTAITAGVDFNIVVLCGRSNGLLDIWILSNDPERCSQDLCATGVHQVHQSPVVAVRQIPDIGYGGENMLVLPEDALCTVLSASKDGSQTVLRCNFSGEIHIDNQVTVGSSSFENSNGVKDVFVVPLSCGRDGRRYLDCIVVREEGISKYLLSSTDVPEPWNIVHSQYKELREAGKLSLRREYTIKSSDQIEVAVDIFHQSDNDSMTSKVSPAVQIPSHVTVMDDSRPVTEDGGTIFNNSSDLATYDSDRNALLTLESMLPIPEINQEYSPQDSQLVSSPSESKIDPFSPSGLLQHSSVTEISQMRFGSPSHARTEKEKEMINELQFAKKDGKLNQIFIQNCVHKINCEPIVAMDLAIDIIAQHTKSARSDVVNLGLLVGLDHTNGLDFLKVCKLVAILNYAHKKFGDAKGKQGKHHKKFKEMKKTKMVVTYNSMGERVVHKEKEKQVDLGYLADGIYKGFMSEIQKIWNQQPPRVDSTRQLVGEESLQSSVGETFPVYLSGIPGTFGTVLNKRYTQVPEIWTADLPHWFDVGRTVRIARSILDSRLMLQRDHLFSLELSENMIAEDAIKPQLQSLQQLTTQYFERNYGAAELNVSHSKVAHFLEACFQYSKFPVLDSLRKFLCPVETNFPFRDTYVWFYVEARDFLYSNNCVFHSSVALTIDSGLTVDSLSVDSASSMTNIHWDRVRRSDARLCALEMFENRGCFGPSTINELDELLSALAPAELAMINDDPDDHLLDLEYFLDAITMFLVNQIAELERVKHIVLSPAIIPRNTRSATLRLHPSRQPMTSDDIAAILNNLRTLCLAFMSADPSRTGIVTLSHFEATMKKHGPERLGIDNSKHFIGLLNSTKSQFTDTATNGIGYVDFIAVMVACVIQNHDSPCLVIEDFIEAVNTISRGVEEPQANALLYFLGHEQCPFPGLNPLWTLSHGNIMALATRQQLKPAGAGADHSLKKEALFSDWRSGLMSISMDGNWHLATRSSSDKPGVMTINKIFPMAVEQAAGERSLGVDGSTWKSETTSNKQKNEPAVKGSGCYVPDTLRDITSILGEARTKKPPKGQAVITPYDLAASLSASELINLHDQIQLGILRNKSAPHVELTEGSDKVECMGSVDSVSKFGSIMSSPKSKSLVHRVPEVREKTVNMSPDRHRQPLSKIHPVMGTSTVFTELAGNSLNGSPSTSMHFEEPSIEPTKRIILRRPADVSHEVSQEGRYNVQGRAMGPILTAKMPDEDIDIEYVQEEYRLSNYRQTKVHKVIKARQDAKRRAARPDQLSLCDSESDSSMSLTGFASLSQWHEISIHDMTQQRRNVLTEEEAAALEMKAERDKFYSELHRKQAELLNAKKEARRKERETNRMAAEQMALKDGWRAKRREEEEQRAAEEYAELQALESEEKARIAAERQRRADQVAAARAAEVAMLERRQENDNLMDMRHEDARCQAIEMQERERKQKAAEKVAAEAEVERKRLLQEVMREQERQEKLFQQEANQKKLADMKMELENLKMMSKEDINVHKIFADAERKMREEEVRAEEERLLEEERAKTAETIRLKTRGSTPGTAGDMSDEEEQNAESDPDTRLQKKIKKFLRAMEKTADGTNLHPRRFENDEKGRKFFMPMMFGEDIRFSPFTAPNYDPGWFQQQIVEDRRLRQSVNEDDYNPTRDFSDITNKVARIKLQQALDQSKMYSVTDSGEDPASVTKVFRNGAVDWMTYMARDKSILDETKDVGTTYTDYKSDLVVYDPLNPIVDNDTLKLKAARPEYRQVQAVTSSKLPVLYRTGGIGVTQLPMGHVVHDKIGKNCYRYYQVNHPGKSSLLTVDLKCNSGQVTALLLWSPDKLPSIAACDEKADCTDMNGYCCRIVASVPNEFKKKTTMKPPINEKTLTSSPRADKKTYKPIIAVYSPDENSEFTLWAIASTDAKVLPKPIEHVTRLIEEFNVLTSHDSDKLSEHFSVYRRDARRIIDEEAAFRAESRMEIQNKIARNVLQPHVEESISRPPSRPMFSIEKQREISDELATMERFIARAGRLAIGNALRSTLLVKVSPKKTQSNPPSPSLEKEPQPIHELVRVDDSDDESRDGKEESVKTDGTPAEVVENSFRGELDSFPMLYTRPIIAKTYSKPDPVIKRKIRPLRKELLNNPVPVSYQYKYSKSTGFLKGSSQQDTFL